MHNLSWPKFRRFWFPVILYSGIIFCVSSVSNVSIPLPGMRFDIVLHVVIYVPYGFLLASAIYNTKTAISRGSLLGLVLLFTFLFGSSDEIHQFFVPGRSADILDLIADVFGGAVGGCIYLLFLKRGKNK